MAYVILAVDKQTEVVTRQKKMRKVKRLSGDQKQKKEFTNTAEVEDSARCQNIQ